MVEILTSLDKLKVEGPTPFATCIWLEAALDAGETPRLIVWHDERNPDARVVAPLCLDAHGCLKFIAQDKADENDAIPEGPDQNRYWAWKEIGEAIVAMADVKRVCLEKMPATSPLAAYLAATLKGALLYRAVGHSRVKATLDNLKQKDRSRIKALLAQPGTLRILDKDNASGDEALGILDGLATQMVAAKKRDRRFWGERERRIFRAMWAAKLAEVAVLEEDGEVTAAAIRYVKNRTAWCWMAFCRNGKELTQLYAKYVEAVAKRGDDWQVDFGSGTYGWKLGTFRPQICPCVTLRWSRSAWGRVGDWARMLARCWRV